MDDPRDFFTNPALRSRLSRMRNPWNVTFGAPRKRRGSNQAQEEEDSGFVEDPHDSFFSKFDPHWSEAAQWPRSTLRKRQPSDHGARSDFFDYFPAEFRQYIPDDFGFHHPPMPTMHQHPTPPRQAPPQTAEKPRFCDAAMQTDEDPPTIEGASHTGKQHTYLTYIKCEIYPHLRHKNQTKKNHFCGKVGKQNCAWLPIEIGS